MSRRKHKVLKMSLKQVFASQLEDQSFVKTLSFLVMDDHGRFQVGTTPKSNFEDQFTKYELIEALPNRLPVFVEK